MEKNKSPLQRSETFTNGDLTEPKSDDILLMSESLCTVCSPTLETILRTFNYSLCKADLSVTEMTHESMSRV